MEKQYERPLGWTTLEEAKLLVDAGLDPNTADLCYCYDYDKSDFELTSVGFSNVIIPRYSYNNSVYERKIPCWSLGMLFDIAYNIVENDWFCFEEKAKKNFITEYLFRSIQGVMCNYDTMIESCVCFVTELLKRRNILKNE